MTPLNPLAPSHTAAPSNRASLDQASRQFEAIFVRQMLAAARQSGQGDPIFGSEAGATFRQMLDDRWADIAADQGALGLGKVIASALDPASAVKAR